MNARVLARTVLLVTCAVPIASSHAAEPELAASGSYGGENALADTAALALLGTSSALGDDHGDLARATLEISVGTYLLGSPVIHLLHGRPGEAFGSLALRVVVPGVLGLAGAGVFYGLDSGREEPIGSLVVGGAIGAGIGMVTAAIIDDSLLTRVSHSDAPPAWTPTVGPESSSGGLGLGVAGTW
jgi:hypothetical protein